MTEISDIYDAIITRVDALLPNHKRLPNPFELDQNPDQYLRQGWTFRVESGQNTNRHQGCQESHENNFSIIITRSFSGGDLRVDKKDDTQKALLEDFQLLMDDFEQTPILDSVHKFRYDTHDAITPVKGDEVRFLSLIMQVRAEYFRNL